MNGPQSKRKSSKREDSRRLATYKVTNCKDSRQAISPGQRTAFVTFIEGNNSCEFGIVRLCALQLDSLYPNPKIPSVKSTLIRFAAKLGRDSIVASLLKGGADPTVFSCMCPDRQCDITVVEEIQGNSCNIIELGVNGASAELSLSINKQLSAIPKPLAVWLIHYMVTRRGQYLLLQEKFRNQIKQELFWKENSTQSNAAALVRLCKPKSECEICNSGRSDTEKNALKCVGKCSLICLDCSHICCEDCYWQKTVVWNDDGVEGGKDIICPICSAMEVPISENGGGQEESKTHQRQREYVRDERTIIQTKDSSRALYEILPKYENVGKHEKKSKFKALQRIEINKIQMGTTQVCVHIYVYIHRCI